LKAVIAGFDSVMPSSAFIKESDTMNLMRKLLSLAGVVALLSGSFAPLAASRVLASDTPTPSSVTLVGSLQSELGCPGDWDPACAASHLAFDAQDGVWQGVWTIPAGNWEYKVALNNSWDENYGAGAQFNGGNISLSLDQETQIKFYFDPISHWITDNRNSLIAVAPGSFQSELGCGGDWDPGCLRSWLQDIDGDGIYSFETTALPAGSYEGKVAINESWDENYGQGGVPGGANISFSVPTDGALVVFRYDSISHVLTIQSGFAPDNNIAWDGLRHDSRDLLYRTPGGAVPAGSPVKIRFRTFHNDVTAVRLRVYDTDASGQRFYPMQTAATEVSCYQPGLETATCDFWEAVLPNSTPSNLWYRFVVTDGTRTVYYADNTPALDGGLGAPSDDVQDFSFALMVYDPAFVSPEWAKNAVIYQIFPDRFRNGDPKNDLRDGVTRYDDPAFLLPWGTLPEGYCRNYADGSTNCPWRYDDYPPDWSPTKEGPRGRDYYGGDLKGVTDKLSYLKSLGVTVIYFNPIFEAKSNHRYDTSNFRIIDPKLGTLKDFTTLVTEAKKLGMRVVLDGVFNHMSSDSPFFDRYHHYTEVGACESAASPWRWWFSFRAPAGMEPSPCAPSVPGGIDTYYNGWFGFDSIPVMDKTNPEVVKYFVTANSSITRTWLNRGASGWRLDVMGDPSFPTGYWETFREVVKSEDPNAVIIGELWQKDSTLLRFLRGDRADSTMNYRLRDAVLGLLVTGAFDSKGFADSGYKITPSQFAARVESIREDYPDAAFYSLMNLLGSHDTERLLWTLTPGVETRAEKEFNADNLSEGKQRVQLASLIQYTMPGAPTVYYGDEVGITGDDDPDDRRTYPWADTGGTIDSAMLTHYKNLAAARSAAPVLVGGDLRVLLADDAAQLVAYGRKTGSQAAMVVLNLGSTSQEVVVPVGGYLPDGTILHGKIGVGLPAALNVTVSGGEVRMTLPALGGLLLTTNTIDLTPPAAPTGLVVSAEGDSSAELSWNPVSGAAGYNVYRSPVSGGGWIRANAAPVTGTTFADSGLVNAQTVYYIVRSLDAAGNESGPSNEVSALPHLVIGWANLQWPPELTHTISAVNRTSNVYGQVWIDGATSAAGVTPSLRAQLGYGASNSMPGEDWQWIEAVFNTNAGNNDEFAASLLPESVGSFDYAYRYTTTNGREWIYADLDGISNGYSPEQAGKLTVLSSGDLTAPEAPANLQVLSASAAGVALAWDAVSGDATLYGYEVRRSDSPGGPFVTLALLTGVEYIDTSIAEGSTYYYVVRAVDLSFNRSVDSMEVSATPQLRTVSVTFMVTVPEHTDATGRMVHIAGFLDRLDGNMPQWDPGGVVLTRVDATHWSITLTGAESTQIEYKYALGSWDFVEKDGSCGEIPNRFLTLTYGSTGSQVVNDIVLNWRNVAPCGN
jgi:glycosidase/fibronectin type 3 domain-containing protein